MMELAKGDGDCYQQLQNLEVFHIGGSYSGHASLDSGALLGGSAGQIDIYGNNNQFHQGNSDSKSTAALLLVL